MIKRVIILALILSLFANISFAELEVSSMTDDELKAIITLCSSELRSRHTVEEEGILIFDQGGMRLYQIGEAEITFRGRISIPVMIYNDLEINAALSPTWVVCNGYSIGGNCGSSLPPKSKKESILDFSSEDLKLSSLDEIDSFIFGWSIYSFDVGSVLQTESEEHRFW